MRNVRRGLAVVLALVMLLPSILIPGMAAGKYQDVPDSSWYSAAVEYVTEKGYMAGVSEDSFAPNTPVTRAMFVTVLAKVAGVKGLDDTATVFSDVPAGKWYTGSVAWAAQNGIVSGVSATEFAPNRKITRQDMCVVLSKFVQVMEYELPQNGAASFNDAATISGYARSAVAECTAANLIAGFSDGTFRPKGTATRAQIAVIIMRLAELLEGKPVDPVPMPAQEFNGAAGEDMTVAVNAPEGALPENTNMTVSRVTDEAALAAISEKTGAKVYAAADITFTKDGAELEPEKNVEVQIALDGLESIKNPTVVHVKDDGSLEYIAAEMVSVTRDGQSKALRFYADSFSVYAVIGGTGAGSTLTITFYARENGSTGAWQPVNKQILRADQLGEGKFAISDPGVPNITTSQAFEGWAIEGIGMPFNPNYSYTADTDTYSVKQINDYHNSTPLTTNTEVACYAAVFDVVYITYHDQAGAVIYAEYKKLVEGAASADVQLAYNPFKDNQNFSGWVTKNYVKTIGSIDGTMPVYNEGAYEAKWEVGTTQTITASVDLYPYVEEGFWLIFDNNIAGNNEAFGYNDDVYASYTPSEFVGHGRRVTEPTAPTRAGYDFGGWYTDKAMTNAYDWGSAQNPVYLTAETTLYAKWNRLTTADYTVVIWLQRVSDNMNAADADKTYDYYFSTTLSGSTGANVLTLSDVTYFQNYHTNTGSSSSTNSLYMNTKPDGTGLWKSVYGFHYLRTSANSTTIRSNGSTVVNVYWDRDIVTYRFYSSSYNEYTNLKAQGLYEAPYTGWNTSYMWHLTNTGGVPSSGNTSNVYVSISTKFTFYSSGNDTPSVLRSDKTVYFYAGDAGTNTATLSHYTQQVDAQGNTYYPSTPEKTVSIMDYYNKHAFREFVGHDYDTFRIKLPSSSGTYYYTNASGETDSRSYTRPFSYRVVTDYSGSGTSASYTWSGDWITPSSTDGYWTEWIPYGSSLVIIDANDYVIFSPAYLGTMYGYNAAGKAIDFRYKLVQAKVTYMYGTFVDANGVEIPTQYAGTIHTSGSYYYGQDITAAGSYTPTVPGYVFVGWYSSPECDAESSFSFTGEKMPEGGVTVYAKFQQMSFRVICDPTDDGKVTDVSFPGAQATMFCLDYGEKVSGTALNAATAPGKILLGWYTDKECTKPFSFSTPITDTIDGMDMTYATATNKSGVDPWNNNKAYTDDDTVVGKLVLYAKWREDPEGVIGIKVRYLGDHAENDKGYFDTNGKPHTVTMEEVFTDQALAAAHAASIPSLMNADTKDENRRFLYWEILDKNGNPTGKTVYPGAPFTVDINDAVEIKTPLPDPRCNHSGTRTHHDAVVSTCTVAGNAEYWTCDACGATLDAATGGNVFNPALPLAAHTWGDWIPGSGDSHYHVCSVCQTRGGEPCVYGEAVEHQDPQVGVQGYDKYVCSVCGREKTVTIPALTAYSVIFHVPENVGLTAPATVENVPAGNFSLEGYSPTGTLTVEGWEFIGWVSSEVSNTTSEVQPLDSVTISNSDVNVYALFVRTETSVVYQIAEAPENGGKYVIVADETISGTTGSAVGNTAAYNGSYLTPVAITINSDDTCTVSDPASVLWVAAGNSTNGYTYYNEAEGVYMGLNSSEVLAPVSSGLAWHYTSDKYLDNKVDSEGYYYLSYAAADSSRPNRYTTGKISSDTTYNYVVHLYQAVDVETNTYSTAPADNASSAIYYTRVESTSDLTAGTYLIVCEYSNVAFNGALTTLDAANNNVPVTISNNQIEATSAMDNASFTIAASGTYWSIKSASGYYIGRESNTNGLETNQSTQFTNSISITNGNALVNGSGGAYLRYYSSANNYRFRYFKSSSYTQQKAIQLYKRETSLTNVVVEPMELENKKLEMGFNAAVADTPEADPAETRGLNPGEPVTATTVQWVPTDTIEPGEEYLLGFVLNGNTYLGLNSTSYYRYYMPYSTSSGSTATSSTYSYMGYTGTPVFSGENIIGITGNASDLANATWKFSSVTGGYNIVSGASASNYLYANASTSSNPWWDQYVNSTKLVWTWDAASHQLYNSANSVYAGVYTNSELSDVYMCCDTDSESEYIYVQLYKKETITTYNVTVNTAANGNVRSDHTTALEGDEVRLTLTPSEDYEIDTVTVTASNGTAVQVTNVSGGIYTFTMPAADVTVSATFKEVVTSTVWTVSFADENGRAIPGMNDIFVPKDNNSLAESDLPDPAKTDHYFLGWYQDGTQCSFPLTVNSDITLTPKYSPMYSYDYTLTLRAVYGPFNPDATTHIYWYANNGTEDHNGAGERYVSEYKVTEGGVTTTTTRLPINAQVDIPLPSGSANQTVFVGDNGGALTWDDHVFLGWARVDNTGNEGEEQRLTEENLYLKWTGEKYQVKNDDGVFVDFTSQKVYADETTPYHDMYAVWSGYAYVFHSATGKMEAIPTNTKSTVDLTQMVTPGHLYGGYYTTYGGAKDILSKADYVEQGGSMVVNTGSMRDYKNQAIQKSSAADPMVQTSAATYNGSAIKNGDTRFWTRANAYGYGSQAEAPSGNRLIPTAGTVYYLKEVPEQYLTTKYLYTYETLEGAENEGQIVDFYMLTLVDDNLYNDVGFRTNPDAETVEAAAEGDWTSKQTLTGYFSITQKGNAVGKEPVTITVNAESFGLTSGFVAFSKQNSLVTDNAGGSFTLMPGWKTLDGVDVNSHGTLKLTVDAAKTKVTYELLGSVATPTTLYIDTDPSHLVLNQDDGTVWETADALTRVYIFNGSKDMWLDATKVRDNYYSVSIPAGDWTLIVVRCNPDSTKTGWDAAWAQTVDIPLDRSKDLLILNSGFNNGKLNSYTYTVVNNN